MEEVWKDIDGYEGLYQVSNFGEVKSLERRKIDGRHCREKILKQGENRCGYFSCELCKDGTGKRLLTHRMVAQTFIPNPEGKKEVNHINGDKSDNRVENLEWSTRRENELHAFRTGMAKNPTKPVLQYDLNGNFIQEWSSAKEAATTMNLKSSNICHCCKGRIHHTGGYIWKYREAN